MDRMLSVTVEGQRSPGRVSLGWVREVVERYRAAGIEPHIVVEAKHGRSHVSFTIPPPTRGAVRKLDPWETAIANLWNEHDLNTTPVDLGELCAFLERAANYL